ncbi:MULTISPECIES: L-2-amino-thiazoline-4-carboxylic acid hydrolase [Fusobacterium]|uniref:L-2-amino-thiazoline-4-carboxylic acid hydrolase n=1 Tax=Fusobacterium TaxID=848 RepID=UPI001D0AD4BE|nr:MULTISPECIES: L-2-amino-thiazoline-4-carboxylic acid hydrolase [Fusobacterium]MCB8564770.1 L-2-amino-thiazoline-4-carboxylic acid hydrolase [Fusobacterium ulcerans]MCB8648848.1 L-2-amino-thiazoline-4-carboxylic acid hydrolase [Fusobacterium ulcerans]MDH6457425.1 hypothetical protein [Fusobacterium sp. PH5-7]MEE0138146.1 L-2-amino-thiazoline-4-carboxylic acid hydrolase [Fusobacterium ulcerans]
MSKIKNEGKNQEKDVQLVRGAIEQRAAWLGLMYEEAKKQGKDIEDIARKAIFKCGCVRGKGFESVMKDHSIQEFKKAWLNENNTRFFEMEIVEDTEEALRLYFHHCPLVSGWVKQGFSDEDVEILCDIAMDGDRGMASPFQDEFTFELGKTIAQGNCVCELNYIKNKK